MSSSIPQNYVYLIPFVLPPVIRNGTRMGRGRLFIVSQTAGGAFTLSHLLGRVPQVLMILDNGTGDLGDRAISSRTSTQIVFTPTVNLVSAVVWVV